MRASWASPATSSRIWWASSAPNALSTTCKMEERVHGGGGGGVSPGPVGGGAVAGAST